MVEVIRLPGEKTEHSGLPIVTRSAKELLGWLPEYTLEEGLVNTINWHKVVQNI